jgi:hypothetical protein
LLREGGTLMVAAGVVALVMTMTFSAGVIVGVCFGRRRF